MKKTKEKTGRKTDKLDFSAKPQKTKRLSRAFSLSIIIYAIDRLADKLYDWFLNGFFGWIFSAYSKEQLAFEHSFTNAYFAHSSESGKYFRSARKWLSKSFEESFVIGILRDICNWLLTLPLKTYGNFFMSAGLYTVFSCIIRELLPIFSASPLIYYFCGAISICISFPMLLSRQTLLTALGQGRMTSALFVDVFGFSEEAFEIRVKHGKAHSNFAILLGMVVGLLAFVIHPLQIACSLAGIVIMVLIVRVPEAGILLSIFFLPFFSYLPSPSLILFLLVMITFLSYVLKLVQGKRTIKFELIDVCVLLFMVVFFMSGVIGVGGDSGFREAVLCCVLMLGYFLFANLVRTEKWLKRMAYALVSAATVVAVIGIFQYFLGSVSLLWLDETMFPDIKGRVVSCFDNANVLALYLVMVFPVALATFRFAKTRSERAVCACAVISIILCTVFTWSRSAWVAMLAVFVLYCLINTRKTVRWLIGIGFALPFITMFLPATVLHRFSSIGDMSDSSTYYRLYNWRGTLEAVKDHLWSGIGYGNAAYDEIYPHYAYAGIESAEHSHNLFLQILLGLGIFGLILFAVVLFLYLQKSAEYMRDPFEKSSSVLISAAFCAVCGALIISMFDFIWYNSRMFYMFWVLIGYSCACVRFGNRERKRLTIMGDSDGTSACIDL